MPATTFNLCFVFVCDVLPGGGPMLDIAMSSPRSESATAVRSGPRSRSRSRSRTPEPPRGAVSAEYATVTVSSPPGRDASQTSPAPAPSPHPPELRTRSIPWVHRARGKVLGGPNDAGNHIQGFHDVLGHDLHNSWACVHSLLVGNRDAALHARAALPAHAVVLSVLVSWMSKATITDLHLSLSQRGLRARVPQSHALGLGL